MRYDARNTRSLSLAPNQSATSLRPILGIGPTGATGATGSTGPVGAQGPPGPGTGAGAWQASTAYTANQVVQAPDGSIIYRLTSGTSRASFDGTEAALWAAVSSKAGTIEQAAQSASFVPKLDNASTSANGAVTIEKLTKVDASAAARAMTIPDGTIKGQQVAVEKTDSSANLVTVTGKIRSTGSSSITLTYQYETLLFIWGGTFWEPLVGHRTKVSLDTQIAAGVAPTKAASRTGIYLPSDWGLFWKAKLAAAPASKPVLAVAGDSISQGFWTSALRTKSWVGLTKTGLQTLYGDGGSGYYGAAYALAGGVSGYSADEHVVSTGSWSRFNGSGKNDGPSAFVALSANASGTDATMNFTKVRGTTVVLYWLLSAGAGTFTYSIDGAAAVAVNTAGSGNVVTKTTITGLSAGDHTVLITVAAGQASVFFYGVSGENATGLVVNNYSVSGDSAANFAGSGVFNSGNDRAPVWSGGPKYPCDLLIYALGVNEGINAVAADTYIDSVSTFLRSVRDGGAPKNGQTDILILAQHIGSADSAVTKVYHNYVQRLRGLAEGYGAGLVDMWALYRNSYAYASAASFWSNGSASGAAGTNSLHPGDVGNGLIRDVILPIVGAP